MPQVFANNARALLASGITAGSTSLTVEVDKADLFPTANVGANPLPSADDWFKVTLQDVSGNVEIMYVRSRTAGSGVMSNILRGQEGTTARSFTAGSAVGLRLTALDIEQALTLAAQDNLFSGDNTFSGNNVFSGTNSFNNPISAPNAVPTGAVMAFATAAPPTAWLACNGAAVSRTVFADLFAAIGTTYGAGDGNTTFNLPDLRGEFIRGLDSGRGVDAGRTLGSAQSSQNLAHTHTGTTEFQSNDHTHTGATDVQGQHQHIEGEGVRFFAGRYGTADTGNVTTAQGLNGYDGQSGSGNITSAAGSHAHNISTGGVSANHTHYFTSASSGGGEARPRNVALLYCIKV